MKKNLFRALLSFLTALTFSTTSNASEIELTELAERLNELPKMAIFQASPIARDLQEKYNFTHGKNYPSLDVYPFLRVSAYERCVDTSYNPAGLLVSIATFPLAVASNGGFWKASAGSFKCKEGSKIETKIKFVVFKPRVGDNFTVVCGTDEKNIEKCKALIEQELKKWNKDAQILTIPEDEMTKRKIIGEWWVKIRSH